MSDQSVIFESIVVGVKFFGVQMKCSGGGFAVRQPAPAAEALLVAEQTTAGPAALNRPVSFHRRGQFSFSQLRAARRTEFFAFILENTLNTVFHFVLFSFALAA